MNTQNKIQHFENACKKAGLKLTHQRLEIYRELAQATDHPSAETIYKRLLDLLPTISLDTVYRTLHTLEKHGLVTKVQTIESQARFEAEISQHHHLICESCGSITDFQWEGFDESILPKTISKWGKINHKNVTLNGICNRCAKTNNPIK